jgi:enamine deaminase RidA (YjgF/YER057c/UK114 family)
MGGVDAAAGEVVSDDVVEQTHQEIINTAAILSGAGCALTDVATVTSYLTDPADYERVKLDTIAHASESALAVDHP